MSPEPDSRITLTICAATIDGAARALVGGALPDADLKAVAELTANLFGEMTSLRSFDVGETEPANIYRADA